MKSKPKPISIPPEIAARCDGQDQFQKFDQLLRTVIAVPHSEIVKREAEWNKTQAKKKQKK